MYTVAIGYNYFGVLPVSLVVEFTTGSSSSYTYLYDYIMENKCTSIIIKGKLLENVNALRWLVPRLLVENHFVVGMLDIADSKLLYELPYLTSFVVSISNTLLLKSQTKVLTRLTENDVVFLTTDNPHDVLLVGRILEAKKCPARLVVDSLDGKIQRMLIARGIHDVEILPKLTKGD